MTGYQLGVVHGAMVSRSRAAEAWAEADRIEATALHDGVLDALKKIGWTVDIDDSRADVGKTRWLLWAKDADDAERIVEGTPLGYLGLLKAKSVGPKNKPATREWLYRVMEGWPFRWPIRCAVRNMRGTWPNVLADPVVAARCR